MIGACNEGTKNTDYRFAENTSTLMSTQFAPPSESPTSSRSNVLEESLHRYFGFSTFRPLQREIVQDLIDGKDVLALLPTGGGKSLCYQLPALLRPGLTVVISPLIALMKDQVDGLLEMDIPATFLNSSLSTAESKERWRDLHRGRYKILYLAPERLMTPGMFEALRTWNLGMVAVDEAHCISDWGHDFRPEYRQLALLRETLPQVPIAAFTATATARVKEDIIRMLRLTSGRCYVASFNRPNLSYRILPRANPLHQVKEIISEHPGESGIIYCMTRNRTDELAASLTDAGIPALSYHAGLDAGERALRQERFLRDEVPVMVATVAFGMGVDKPDVRYVIHHDLPKNIESYYQETGRAGRDGLPSECVLLYSSADTVKLRHFIDEMSDSAEREIASRHLSRLIEFCESAECRRVGILRYFGETYSDSAGDDLDRCGACDNCLTPRERFDGSREAKMLLSCVVRVRQKSRFSVGLQHLVDVLVGSKNEKVIRWGHDQLSTYGIGSSRNRQEWSQIGRELLRLGLLSQNHEKFNVLELTEAGADFLRSDEPLEIAKPLGTAKLSKEKKREQKAATGAVDVDQDLLSRLKDWRRNIARERGVPAYVIFHDSTLQAIAREKPGNLTELSRVPGLGEKKLAQYGGEILELL